MKTDRALRCVALLFGTLLTTATTAEAQHDVWHTTSSNEANKLPGSAGSSWNKNGAVPAAPLPNGSAIWFGFLNEEKPPPFKKWLRIEITAAGGIDVSWLQVEESTAFESDGSRAKKSVNYFKGDDPDIIVGEYSWSPQPQWERFKFRNQTGAPIPAGALTVKVRCACEEAKPRWLGKKIMSVREGSFGAAGTMMNDARTTQIWYFPEGADLDTGATPTFSGAVGSGNWTYQYVFTDPEGAPRPQGGVRWDSDGVGLGPGELYDLDFTMTSAAPYLYWLFAYDADAGEYQMHKLLCGAGSIPTVSEWGVMVLILLLLTAGTVVFGRQRPAAA